MADRRLGPQAAICSTAPGRLPSGMTAEWDSCCGIHAMESTSRFGALSRALLIAAALWGGVLSGAFCARAYADAALDDYNLAVGLYKQTRWATAAERFRLFLKNHETHEKASLAQLYLGLTLVNLEDYRAARDELRLFLKTYPESTHVPQARYRVAECSYLLEDLPVARAELTAYLRDFPADPLQDHALPYLADVQLRLKDPAAALVNFQLAIDRFPKGPLVADARFGRARALEQLQRPDDAVTQYKELAIGESPRAEDAQFHLGLLAFERKRYAEAATAYADLTTRFPKSRYLPAARLNAGYSLFQLGKFAEAAVEFEAAAREKSQTVAAEHWRGQSLKSLGQFPAAIEAFQASAAAGGELPLAGSSVFHQALCERQLGHAAAARQAFETVVRQWPRGDYSDDSVHALAELAIDAGDLTEAERRLAQLTADYPESTLKVHGELLSGRLELARAAVELRDMKPAADVGKRYDAAATRFQGVMNSSTIASTQQQARYYLAFTRQLQGQAAQALELLAPLIEQVRADRGKSEVMDALVLKADVLLSEKQNADAEATAQEYLALAPTGRQAARALSIQAVAAARRNEPTADAALTRLNAEFTTSPLRAVTTHQLAELAEGREDWPAAARYYEALIPLWTGAESLPYAIRGLAWAQYKQKQSDTAALTFARVASEFPEHRLAVECTYYRAEAIKEGGNLEAAIAAFDELLKKVPTDPPAAAGAEQQPPALFSYRAGLQAARLYRKLKRVPDADAEYDQLLKRFPRAQHLDQLLDEWALLNYDAGQYDKADAIFTRLIQDAPDSPLADNARLSLAESDLIAERLDVARKAFEELLASPKSDAEVKERSLYQLLVLAVDQQRWDDVGPLADRMAADFPNSAQQRYATYSRVEATLANPKSMEAELDSARQRLVELQQLQTDAAIRSQPWFDRVWVLLAEVAFRQKKYDEVESVVTNLRERAPQSAFLYQADEVLGRAYKQQAPPRFDDARKAFERVLSNPAAERTETAAVSQFLIGETLFLQEKWGEAFLAYQKVFANYDFPEWQAAALLQSGKCDEQQQQWKEAAATYQLLIDRFPKSRHADDAKARLEIVKQK